MPWNKIYDSLNLQDGDTPEHRAIALLLEKSDIEPGDCTVGGVADFYVSSTSDENAQDLVDRLNELCGVYEVPAAFYLSWQHILI